jgi:peptidyl-prolyl cis-trans isomerase D
MQVRSVDSVDRSGRAPDGAPVTTLPQGVDLLTPAFAAEVGAENDPLQAPGGGYVWYEVADVTPSRERSLDEVKDRVEERWREDEIASRLRSKATELVEKAKAGTPLAEAAAGVPVQTIGELKRGTRSDSLGPKVIDEVFRTAKGAVGTAEGERGERVVFRVTDIVEPKTDPDSAEAKRISENLTRSLAEDLYAQYVVQLQNDIGTSINQSALNQVVGGGTN